MSKKIILRKVPDKLKNPLITNAKQISVYQQISMINQIYLNEEFEHKNDLTKLINKKINGYKSQDVKKQILDKVNFIDFDKLIEKLVISKLRCYYCRQHTYLVYENKREPKQWTLDRLDNNLGHSNLNTVICCLKCNLERRCANDENFKFGKQLRLIKKY